MGYVIACEQDDYPQTILPSPHVVLASRTKCQPHEMHLL